jgi:hypothetical protein
MVISNQSAPKLHSMDQTEIQQEDYTKRKIQHERTQWQDSTEAEELPWSEMVRSND